MKDVKPFPETRGSLVPAIKGWFRVAIDPGTRMAGWALFGRTVGQDEETETLLACGLGDPPLVAVQSLAIELPQSYPSHPVPPNDLIQLAFVAGRYVGRCPEEGVETATLFPHEWKGNLSKEVCGARVRSKLSSQELLVLRECEADVPKGAMHNVLDAIGIGLYAFRKIKI